MKLLSALVVGGALLASGCVQKEVEVDESPEEASKQDTDRKISNDELQNRGGFWYVKGETYRFSGIAVSAENQSRLETPYIAGKKEGTAIQYHKDGWKESEVPFVDGKVSGKSSQYYPSGAIKGEIPYVNGEAHGNGISYREDGSKMFVTPYVRGKRQGTAMHYHEDGTKWEEVIWENGKEVSKKSF